MSHDLVSIAGAPIGLSTGDPNDGLPGTGKSGPRGIESVIEFNGLYMNVRSWVDTYLVTTIGGLDDADIRDSREINPGYHGETPYKSFYGGRTITLTGKVRTKTIFKLRDMQQGMRQAFGRLDVEFPLIFRAAVPENDSMIYCRKSQSIQMADAQRTANHFERDFLITLRASNPRFLSTLQQRSNIIFSSASYDAVAYTVVNHGNFEAQPMIEMIGPIATLMVEDESNGQQIMLTGAIPAGETWVLDINARRMYRRGDEANRFMYLDVNSDWLELSPGNNNMHVTATGLTAGTSQLTFNYRDTYM